MGKEILAFDDSEIEKQKFTVIKILFLHDVGTDNILISKKISSSEKNINTSMVT